MKKRFYAWMTVFVCILMMACVNSPIFTLPGTFAEPVSEEFGIPRATFNLHILLCMCSCFVSTFFVGKLQKRMGAKRLIIASIFLTAACFLMYAFAKSIRAFYLASILIGICGVTIGLTVIADTIKNWFPPQRQGRAIGIAMCGSGIGSMLLVPLVSWFFQNSGWRHAYLMLAGLLLFLLLPAVLFLFYECPEKKGFTADTGQAGVQTGACGGLSYQEAKKTRSFRLCFLLTFLGGFIGLVFNTGGYSYLCSVGIAPAKASAYVSIGAATLMCSKILMGNVCDKIGTKRGALLSCFFYFIGYTLIILSAFSPRLALPAVIIFGMGNIMPSVIFPLIMGEVFGRKDFGIISGVLTAGMYAGDGLGPYFSALVFDLTGSYVPSMFFVLFLVLLLAATVIYIYKYRPDFVEN